MVVEEEDEIGCEDEFKCSPFLPPPSPPPSSLYLRAVEIHARVQKIIHELSVEGEGGGGGGRRTRRRGQVLPHSEEGSNALNAWHATNLMRSYYRQTFPRKLIEPSPLSEEEDGGVTKRRGRGVVEHRK